MALNSTELENFKTSIKKASEELKLNELIFQTEWIFDLPSQSLKIGEVMLHNHYNMPIGWDGYGIEDLEMLEQEGFLKKNFRNRKRSGYFRANDQISHHLTNLLKHGK